MSFDAVKNIATSDFVKDTIVPSAIGVGGAFLARELAPKPKAPKVSQQQQTERPEPMPMPPPIVIEAPSLPPLPTPPRPQSPGGRTKQEQKGAKDERRRLQRASGRASTILVGIDEEEEEDALKGNIKRKSLLGGTG